MRYIIKSYDSYYTGKFESNGVVIMISHSNIKEHAKIFNSIEEINEELKNVKNYNYEIEEV